MTSWVTSVEVLYLEDIHMRSMILIGWAIIWEDYRPAVLPTIEELYPIGVLVAYYRGTVPNRSARSLL